MAIIIAYDCRCGKRYSVYMPAMRFVFDPKKKYIQAAKEWDEADAASGKIKEAEQLAVNAGITFIDAGTIEAYKCKCGKVISLIDFMTRWFRNIRNKRKLHPIKHHKR